jgi:hypothetical protein
MNGSTENALAPFHDKAADMAADTAADMAENRDADIDAGIDAEILDGISRLITARDPPLDAVVGRFRFALAARGGATGRTVTFESGTLSILFRISPAEYDHVRIDGWIASPRGRAVELWSTRPPVRTGVDEQGRFAFEKVPHGLVQFAIDVRDGDGPMGRPFVRTPSVVV